MKLKNKNDKILVMVIVFIIIVVVLVIIGLKRIWFGNDVNKDINTYTYKSLEIKIITNYEGMLRRVLNKKNVDQLIEKLDDEYLESLNLKRENKQQIIKYLNKMLLISDNPVILEYDISRNNDTGVYVYSFKYRTNGLIRYVYIKETEPYVYTLSLGKNSDSILSSAKDIVESGVDLNKKDEKIEKISTDTKDLDFQFTLLKSTSTSIEYNVRIYNKSKKTVVFNFNDMLSTELVFNDGSTIHLGTVFTLPEKDMTVSQNGILNQYMFFEVPFEDQGKIASMKFSNVKIDGEEVEINVNM